MKLLLIINYFFRNLKPQKCSKILIEFSTKVRIRYGETDQMGVVYHGNYAQYFEIARTEWLRTLGVTYKDMENEGIMLPVISLSFKFLHSAKYDDLITINISIKKPPMVKIEFDYEILNEDGKLLTTGNSILAFMDIKTSRPMKCPNYILEKLSF